METETAKSDKKVAKIRNNEDIVMFILQTVVNAFGSEVEEHEVGKRVDDFRRVLRGIVILRSVSWKRRTDLIAIPTYFFTPVQR